MNDKDSFLGERNIEKKASDFYRMNVLLHGSYHLATWCISQYRVMF